MNLNRRASQLCELFQHDSDRLRVGLQTLPCGAQVVDCGVNAEGGLEAGVLLAKICLADLGKVAIESTRVGNWEGPGVVVSTDQPILACLASQYAGWEVKGEEFFAMGSGPMRAAAVREPLFEELGYREFPEQCVGVLESSTLPTDAVCRNIADACRVTSDKLALLVAPTRSIAGTVQIVARSIETALHKLHEIGFSLDRVVSGWGTAPLPPPASNDLAAIGRTNDAILYGGRAVLYVRGDDESLEVTARQIPSSASQDYGRPFAEIMAKFNNDFYQIDPLLFSPATITFYNLDTGRVHACGALNREVLSESFGWH